MSKYINDLIFAVREIQKKEWHNATRKGSTAIGKTFEDLLDKEEDNKDIHNFYDIKIKKNDKNLIIEEKKKKKKEWHNETRKRKTAIEKTFEDLLDKEEDNNDLPDFYDIEIKTHETVINSMLTMFTKSPTYPKGANTM